MGGAEHSLLDLAGNLDPARFSPRIVCAGEGPLLSTTAARGIPIQSLTLPAAYLLASSRGRRTGIVRVIVGTLQSLPAVYRIRRLALGGRATILHSNGNKTHLLSAIAGIAGGPRVVWHVRDFLPDKSLERLLVRLANHRVSAIIANSKAVAEHLIRLGARPEIVHAIHNGIDCARFSPDGPRAELWRQFGWQEGCRLVGIIGVLAPWKGQSVFLQAAREVLVERPDARFVVVGDEIYRTDGHAGYREELVRIARELGVSHAVAFMGYREDIPEIMRSLDVVVHASIEPEPFGRVVAEALACARPVVATDGGGVPEITGPSGEVALLAQRGDPTHLASAISIFLDQPGYGKALGAAGRARVLANFEIRHHVQRVESLYDGLIPPRRLRVTHAGKYYPPVRGGMETVLRDLCTGTSTEWDVRAVVANTRLATTHEQRDGIRLTRAAAVGRIGPVPICPTMPLHLWRERSDCVVLHEPNALAALLLLMWMRARRLVIWHHSDPLRPTWALRPYSWIQQRLYSKSDCVIVSSPRLAKYSSVVGHGIRIAIIPYGISLKKFSQLDADASFHIERLKQTYPPPRTLFVGRFVYYK
ncbi:MAG: glycosyltransferase, partial [candidate division NC10 bacterium]